MDQLDKYESYIFEIITSYLKVVEQLKHEKEKNQILESKLLAATNIAKCTELQ